MTIGPYVDCWNRNEADASSRSALEYSTGCFSNRGLIVRPGEGSAGVVTKIVNMINFVHPFGQSLKLSGTADGAGNLPLTFAPIPEFRSGPVGLVFRFGLPQNAGPKAFTAAITYTSEDGTLVSDSFTFKPSQLSGEFYSLFWRSEGTNAPLYGVRHDRAVLHGTLYGAVLPLVGMVVNLSSLIPGTSIDVETMSTDHPVYIDLSRKIAAGAFLSLAARHASEASGECNGACAVEAPPTVVAAVPRTITRIPKTRLLAYGR